MQSVSVSQQVLVLFVYLSTVWNYIAAVFAPILMHDDPHSLTLPISPNAKCKFLLHFIGWLGSWAYGFLIISILGVLSLSLSPYVFQGDSVCEKLWICAWDNVLLNLPDIPWALNRSSRSWAPVREVLNFRILTMTNKSLFFLHPPYRSYFKALVARYAPLSESSCPKMLKKSQKCPKSWVDTSFIVMC